MTLAVHSTIGMIVGRLSPHPVVAFLLGIVSHFGLDMIPHGDEYMLEDFQKKRKVRGPVAYVVMDGALTAIMVAFIFSSGVVAPSLRAAWGMVGGLLPDVLVGLYELFHVRVLRRFAKFHQHNHGLLIRKVFGERDIKHRWALIYQGAFLVIFLTLLR